MRGKKRASLLQPARPAETTIFKKIVETLEKHHLPRPSEMVERFKFHSRYRKVDEGVVTYVAASCKLSGHCNYGETLLEMLRDRLVCSVNNEKNIAAIASRAGFDSQEGRRDCLGDRIGFCYGKIH